MLGIMKSWGNYLDEAMNQPEELPENFILVLSRDSEDILSMFFYDTELQRRAPPKRMGSRSPGEMVLEKASKDSQGSCYNGWVVSWSNAEQGWGPMLYDIAIEWASQRSVGLMADRESVSPEARYVWDYYNERRPDIKKIQLDDLKNHLTPQEIDNCVQVSADHGQNDWQNDALSKVYQKKTPEMIQKLSKLGKIEFKEA